MGHGSDKFDIFTDADLFKLIFGKAEPALTVAAAAAGKRAQTGSGKAQRRISHGQLLQLSKKGKKSTFCNKNKSLILFRKSDPCVFAVTPPLPGQSNAPLGINRVIVFTNKNHFFQLLFDTSLFQDNPNRT